VILALAFVCIFGTDALAAPLRIAAPPGATVEVLPPVEPGRVEILVHGGDRGLRTLFRGPPADGVRTGRVTDMGGHQVVTVWMRDPNDTLAIERVGEGWEAVAVPVGPAPSTNVECVGTPGVPLVPLRGADMVHEFAPDTFVLAMPRWEAAEPDAVSWERVTALRSQLFGGTGGAVATDRAHALYELGAQHRDLGHLREAAYYFESAATAGAAGASDSQAGAPAGVAELQRAGALLALHAWSDARDAADVARKAGAPTAAVSSVLATVSLLTGDPAPAAIGRALAATTLSPDSAPEPALLAGALLLRAGCWTEAAPVLERALAADGERGAMARLLLADARLLAGDPEGADTVLGDLPAATTPTRWSGLARSRTRLVALLRQSPNLWPAMVPTLERAALLGDRSGGDRGAAAEVEGTEALFLLGQIGERLGDDALALRAWGALVDRRRALLAGEPGMRLQAVWARTVGGQLAAGHDIDGLAAHIVAWRPGLVTHVTDPAPLAAVAAAYMRAGLDEEALHTLGVVAEVEGRRGLDDRATILAVAEIYRRTGRPTEALDTLDFLATRPPEPATVARAGILRGRVLLDQGDVDGARAAWTVVAGDVEGPAVGEARVRIALVDAEAGRCGAYVGVEGVEGVDALAHDPLPADLSLGRVATARAACLATVGRIDESRTIAAQAVGKLTDPSTTAWAEVLAGTPPDGTWRRIAADDVADALLRARLSPAPPTEGT
jgi:tetratricopeptide (TPR) repeat protein